MGARQRSPTTPFPQARIMFPSKSRPSPKPKCETMSTTFVSRRILLVEDDDELRYAYTAHLTANGFLVEEAADMATAHKSFMATRPDVAVLDFRLPDGNALDLLPKFKELEPTVPIIVLTGFGSMELGVQLIKSGAEQCLAT